MIGIYKITNKINGKCYIGQSIHIERRWMEHCIPSNKKGLLAKAIKEFGKENFSFEIIEECEQSLLNEKEEYYIHFFNTLIPNGYNIAEKNGEHISQFTNYTPEILQNIIIDLEQCKLSMEEIANKYNVNKSTISRINNGKVHYDKNKTYPIRISIQKIRALENKKEIKKRAKEEIEKEIEREREKYRQQIKTKEKKKNQCCDCGKEISKEAIRCNNCESERRKNSAIYTKISREELKQLIRSTPFTTIGKMFNVSDNAIRKWCKRYNLPSKVKEIKAYTNEEWEKL